MVAIGMEIAPACVQAVVKRLPDAAMHIVAIIPVVLTEVAGIPATLPIPATLTKPVRVLCARDGNLRGE